MAIAPMISPVSYTKVVGFRVKVEAYDLGIEGLWRTLLDHTETNDFIVDDGAAKAFVLVDESTLLLEEKSHGEKGLLPLLWKRSRTDR